MNWIQPKSRTPPARLGVKWFSIRRRQMNWRQPERNFFLCQSTVMSTFSNSSTALRSCDPKVVKDGHVCFFNRQTISKVGLVRGQVAIALQAARPFTSTCRSSGRSTTIKARTIGALCRPEALAFSVAEHQRLAANYGTHKNHCSK